MPITASAIELVNGDTIPALPAAGSYDLYFRGGVLYQLDSAGNEVAAAIKAADKLKLDNIWVDAQAVGILPSNTGAQNVTTFNAWYAAAVNGSTLYFAPGNYDFAGELTCNRDIRLRCLGAGKGRSILRSTSATANHFNQTVAGFYISFEELGFAATVTKTAGAAILAPGNQAYLDIRRCEFIGQFRAIDYVGSGGNVGVINECLFTSPAPGGSQVRINGTGINMMMQNVTINCGSVATVGLEVPQVGALQLSASDLIGGTTALLINPGAGQVCASVFATNVYFDNTLGSCVRITGAGAAVRNKFVACSMTLAAGATSGSAAFECSSTNSAGAQGLDLSGCNILNTFGAANCSGVLLTGAADYSISGNCNIAGWTTGLNLTPHTTAAATIARIIGNVIGPSGGYGANTTGILLNAGAAAYGGLEISGNRALGNTTALTNNLTTNIPANASAYRIVDNPGINPKGSVTTPAIPATTVAATNTTGYRVTIYLKCSATAFTAVSINGVAFAQGGLANQMSTFQLDPGGTIALTYATAQTAWLWVAN